MSVRFETVQRVTVSFVAAMVFASVMISAAVSVIPVA